MFRSCFSTIIQDGFSGYVIQDETQSAHWSKQSLTIHPAVLYVKSEGKVKPISLCFLSDDMDQDTSFVNNFQREICQYLRENYPQVQSVEYFSDGCAGQYKNYKNLLNLSYHFENFGIQASWSFFCNQPWKISM